jgi:hypothetical protein
MCTCQIVWARLPHSPPITRPALATHAPHCPSRRTPQLTWAALAQLSRLPALRQLTCSGVKYRADHARSPALQALLGQLTHLTLGDTCTLRCG